MARSDRDEEGAQRDVMHLDQIAGIIYQQIHSAKITFTNGHCPWMHCIKKWKGGNLLRSFKALHDINCHTFLCNTILHRTSSIAYKGKEQGL